MLGSTSNFLPRPALQCHFGCFSWKITWNSVSKHPPSCCVCSHRVSSYSLESWPIQNVDPCHCEIFCNMGAQFLNSLTVQWFQLLHFSSQMHKIRIYVQKYIKFRNKRGKNSLFNLRQTSLFRSPWRWFKKKLQLRRVGKWRGLLLYFKNYNLFGDFSFSFLYTWFFFLLKLSPIFVPQPSIRTSFL